MRPGDGVVVELQFSTYPFAMYPRDWQQFLDRGHGKEIVVAHISETLVRHLAAASNRVHYRHDYVMKAFREHSTRYEDFGYLFDVLEYGCAFADRPNHLLFMHETDRGWFQAAIKCAQDNRKIYVATFYKTNAKEVIRKTRKYTPLRK